ncbi:caspase family protein [Hydrogenophaga sp. T2]|uniref:caspase family protein n=1 Tax=Hydrogenophaga sp. T2 TaxID=3132823 RepID=UPI003CEE112E
MRRAMVVIGVDRTSGSDFPPLNAAAASAAAMASWGRSQGFEVDELTDANECEVTLAEIFNCVRRIVDKRVYEQLVLYFSGHGLLLAPDSEAWLLSQAPANPNEAVNVTQCIRLARVSGIPHVVFVSDACRSMPATYGLAMVTPGSVFPSASPQSNAPEVDTFYATLPGNPAYEVPPDQAVPSYRALLTHCLLQALKGEPPSLIRQVHHDGASLHVVASRELKRHLLNAVPKAARAASIHLTQSPDIRVESELPRYLAEVTPPPDFSERLAGQLISKYVGAAAKTEASSEPKLELTLAARLYEQLDLALGSPGVRKHKRMRDSLTLGVEDPTAELRRILTVAPDLDANIETGFAFIGIEAERAFVQRGHYRARLTSGRQLHLLRTSPRLVEPTQQADAVLVRFTDGTGMSLSVLPGFIGVVIAEAGRIITVNYRPSPVNELGWETYSDRREEVEESKALMGALALHGQLRLTKATVRAVASELRRYKRVDPTLGLFATYAYALSNIDAEVVSVYRHMYRDGLPVLFDVAMLASQAPQATQLSPAVAEPLKRLDFAPWMPLLSQGWLLLGEIEELMPPVLREARRYLMPGLWTRFAPEGMEILESKLVVER